MRSNVKANSIAKYMGEPEWATSTFDYAYQRWNDLFPVLEKINKEGETATLWGQHYEITPSHVRIGNVLIEDMTRKTPVVQMVRKAVLQWIADNNFAKLERRRR